MKIRLKAKYHFGYTKSGILIDDREGVVPPGCHHEEERRELVAKYPRTDHQDETARYMEERAQLHGFTKDAGRKLNIEKGSQKKPPILVSMNLSHGDCIVMRGKDLQRYYEHAVYPDNNLRFAVTSRHIIPEKLAPHEREGDSFRLPQRYCLPSVQ